MTLQNLHLYHYTSGHGLLGIFESNEIWATSIHHLNDAREFSHSIDLGKSAVKAAASTDIKAGEIAEAVASHLDSISKLSIYVTCFSEIEDSLSQWRGYCPRGFGYSIGFDGERLRVLAQQQGFRFEKCIYDHNIQKRAVEEWANRTMSRLLSLATDDKDIQNFVRDNCSLFLEDFVNFAPLLKDTSFKDEQEWRLIGLIPLNDPRMRVRPGRSMLVRYVPIKLHLNQNNPLIWNVCVGPTPHPRLAIDAVGHFFNTVHIQNGISPSRVPYRDW